jgi:hypothetical protein
MLASSTSVALAGSPAAAKAAANRWSMKLALSAKPRPNSVDGGAVLALEKQDVSKLSASLRQVGVEPYRRLRQFDGAIESIGTVIIVIERFKISAQMGPGQHRDGPGRSTGIVRTGGARHRATLSCDFLNARERLPRRASNSHKPPVPREASTILPRFRRGSHEPPESRRSRAPPRPELRRCRVLRGRNARPSGGRVNASTSCVVMRTRSSLRLMLPSTM